MRGQQLGEFVAHHHPGAGDGIFAQFHKVEAGVQESVFLSKHQPGLRRQLPWLCYNPGKIFFQPSDSSQEFSFPGLLPSGSGKGEALF
jgi:hypothetical protein